MANDTDKQQPCAEAVEAAQEVLDESLRLAGRMGRGQATDASRFAWIGTQRLADIIQSAIDARLAEERKEVERIVRDLITVRATAAEVAEALLARRRKPVEKQSQ